MLRRLFFCHEHLIWHLCLTTVTYEMSIFFVNVFNFHSFYVFWTELKVLTHFYMLYQLVSCCDNRLSFIFDSCHPLYVKKINKISEFHVLYRFQSYSEFQHIGYWNTGQHWQINTNLFLTAVTCTWNVKNLFFLALIFMVCICFSSNLEYWCTVLYADALNDMFWHFIWYILFDSCHAKCQISKLRIWVESVNM